jgi:selenocysteine lyase/cysteine desulfurase
VVLADEYPSNDHTWRRFCERIGSELVVAQTHPRRICPERLLDRRLVGRSGSRRTRCARVGATVAIDARQSPGATPLDVFAAMSGLRHVGWV